MALTEPEGIQSEAYIDKPLQILVQAGQIILSFVVLGDQGLLTLEEFLSGLLQFLTLGVFMVDSGDHQFVSIGVFVFGEQSQKLLDGDQRKGKIFVAGRISD